MTGFELACLPIVTLYVVTRARLEPAPARLVFRLALLAAAAWLGEASCIRLYGFYAYEPSAWSLWLGPVPLFIPLIWPSVVVSAHDVARHVAPRHTTLVAAALVLADASLMEPVAVRAGLWRWSEPGLFDVPLIGIAGWCYFALASLGLFAWLDRRKAPALAALGVLVLAPALTHGLLVATWWGLFRWVQGTVPPLAATIPLGAASLALALAAWRKGLRFEVPPALLWVRVPAALFFFALLMLHGRDDAALVAYAFAFAPPYVALTRLPALCPRPFA